MHPQSPRISDQELARCLRAVCAWCTFMLAALVTLWPNMAVRKRRRRLDSVARRIGPLLILAACERVSAPRRIAHRYGAPKRRGLKRALIGARLRARLRGRSRTMFKRIAALYETLRDLEPLVARLALRLRHGLQRRRIIAPVRHAAPALPRPASTLCAADTS